MSLTDKISEMLGVDLEKALPETDPLRSELDRLIKLADENPIRALAEFILFTENNQDEIERRNAMLDGAREWLTYNQHAIMVEADRRKMSGPEFVKNMLDDIFDVYKNQSDLEIEDDAATFHDV
jgi:hypothetical protein